MVDHPGQIFREKLNTRIIARAFAIFKRSPTFFPYFFLFFSENRSFFRVRRFARLSVLRKPPIFADFVAVPLSPFDRARAFRFNVGAKGSFRNGRRRGATADFRVVPTRGGRDRRPFRATPAVRELPLPRRIRESTR